MAEDPRDWTEHRLTRAEQDLTNLTKMIRFRFDAADNKASDRHTTLLNELKQVRGDVREARELASAAHDQARQNQEALNRVFWLARQMRWIAPTAGAVWMFASGSLSWPELKAMLKSLGG